MMILLLCNPSEDVNAKRTVIRRYIMRIVTLLTVVSLAVVLSLARADDTLVQFDRGIGVDPVSNAQGMAATANVVNRNIVRGVQPASSWVIAKLKAEVKDDGRITVDGRGLVFASGDAIGTALVLTPTGAAASIKVFATLICENVAPFVERNSNPVPLAANGDFKIDDVLSPLPPPPSSCATPVLLIRNAGNGVWFAAGIQKFDDGHLPE
jgi:hypothetical protein